MTDVPPARVKSESEDRKGRKGTRHARRLQLINRRSIAGSPRHAETTLADVAKGAGLSRGIVNFYFESKEKLLVATLQHMAEEYAAHWRSALAKASGDPADQLLALVRADFDPAICNRRKLAAWCAFWGEARSRPTYQAHCGSRDEAYQLLLERMCRDLADSGNYSLDPHSVAVALDALLEGLWLRLMMGSAKLSRDAARKAAISFLAASFVTSHARARSAVKPRFS